MAFRNQRNQDEFYNETGRKDQGPSTRQRRYTDDWRFPADSDEMDPDFED